MKSKLKYLNEDLKKKKKIEIILFYANRFFRSERDLVLAKVKKFEADQAQLKTNLRQNEALLDERRKNIVGLEPKLATLRININELESFEYPQEIETVVMVRLNEIPEWSNNGIIRTCFSKF